jgi:TatD DNase family protein
MLVDSHCHLTDDQFDPDRSEALLRAKDAGVGGIVAIASDRRDAQRIVGLLDGFDQRGPSPLLWGTAGVHPHDAIRAEEGDLDLIRAIVRDHPRVVAVGETGLDFYYDNSPRAVQESLFRDHMTLAEEVGLPVVVHSRSADGLTGKILEEWGERIRGVLHCFTGGSELLDKALRLGWMVSFTGIISFKKYQDQDLVRRIPRERLMVETDAPYLAPVPFRGRRNEPAYVARVAEALASIRDEDLEEVQRYTTENAFRFFDLTS